MRKQQEAIKVGDWKGSWSTESCGGSGGVSQRRVRSGRSRRRRREDEREEWGRSKSNNPTLTRWGTSEVIIKYTNNHITTSTNI